MSLKCKLGLHEWNGCKCSKCGKTRDIGHQWNGCQCSKCYKTRDEGHNWRKDCQRCSVCHKTRDIEHRWNGCRCSNCRETRDQDHDWSSDCEKCSRCAMVRREHHDWTKDSERCAICGRKRTLSQRLRVGMRIYEVENLLGSPSDQTSGANALRTLFGPGTSVGGSARAISSFSQQRFVVWRRPEGEYRLVFEGDTLIEIHSAP
jgi:hypothetical protein